MLPNLSDLSQSINLQANQIPIDLNNPLPSNFQQPSSVSNAQMPNTGTPPHLNLTSIDNNSKQDDPLAPLLKEIEDNPIQDINYFEPDGASLVKHNLIKFQVDLVSRKEIIRKWLEGMPSKEIAADYNLSTRAVNRIVETNETTRMDLERHYLATSASRENYRISETKNNLLSFVDDAIKTAEKDSDLLSAQDKMGLLHQVADVFNRLDNTSRLNTSRPTTVVEHHDVKVDVAAILKELKTPEDKLAFLQSQSNNLKKTYDGQTVSK